MIFAAGEYYNNIPTVPDGAFVIAADAGLSRCRDFNVAPDVILGDFDSLGAVPKEKNVITLPVEKDVTDTYAAVKEGQKHGCTDFFIYGAMGGRPDHTYANIALAADLSKQGCKCTLFGDGYIVTAITDSSLEIQGNIGDTVSVFSFSENSEGVTLEGLKYSLDNARLNCYFPLGVSNELKENKAKITVKNGTLIIMAKIIQ